MSTITGNRRYKVIEKRSYYAVNTIVLESTRVPGIIADMLIPIDLYNRIRIGDIVRVAVFIDKPSERKDDSNL